jgi:hypothetical protein
MMSKGLPGIRGVIVEPRFDEYLYYPMEEGAPVDEEDSLHAISVKVDSIRQAVVYHGLTVGPWAPPSKFDPLVFLDTLTSFVRESHALGWIASQEAAESIISSFARATSDIRDSNIQAAIARINLILVHLEEVRTSVLSPEAYALIRYNSEYFKKMLHSKSPR